MHEQTIITFVVTVNLSTYSAIEVQWTLNYLGLSENKQKVYLKCYSRGIKKN